MKRPTKCPKALCIKTSSYKRLRIEAWISKKPSTGKLYRQLTIQTCLFSSSRTAPLQSTTTVSSMAAVYNLKTPRKTSGQSLTTHRRQLFTVTNKTCFKLRNSAKNKNLSSTKKWRFRTPALPIKEILLWKTKSLTNPTSTSKFSTKFKNDFKNAMKQRGTTNRTLAQRRRRNWHNKWIKILGNSAKLLTGTSYNSSKKRHLTGLGVGWKKS